MSIREFQRSLALQASSFQGLQAMRPDDLQGAGRTWDTWPASASSSLERLRSLRVGDLRSAGRNWEAWPTEG